VTRRTFNNSTKTSKGMTERANKGQNARGKSQKNRHQKRNYAGKGVGTFPCRRICRWCLGRAQGGAPSHGEQMGGTLTGSCRVSKQDGEKRQRTGVCKSSIWTEGKFRGGPQYAHFDNKRVVEGRRAGWQKTGPRSGVEKKGHLLPRGFP